MLFELNIIFNNSSLAQIFQTDSQVAIAKIGANNTPEVVWLAFRPFQNNQIAWQEEYGVYVSNSPIQSRSHLAYFAAMPASLGNTYILQPNGTFSTQNHPSLNQSIVILNEMPVNVTAGLYQSATLNGTSIPQNAISAQNVSVKSLLDITPTNEIAIWLQSGVLANTIITQVTSPLSIFSFGGGQASLNITYDENSGHFMMT